MSIDNLPTLYLAKMDVVPTYLRRFMDWYEDKHAPDTISVDFYSAQGFHCRLGDPLICNVYEIDSSEIFYSEAYQTMRTPESDPQRPEVLDHVTRRSNITYRQVLTEGVELPDRPWSEGSRAGAVDAPVVSVLRFGTDADADDAVVEFFRQDFARMSDLPGFLRVRLAEQHGRPHPARPPTEPRWVVLAEWSGLEEALAAGTADDILNGLATAPGNPTEASYCVAQCVTSIRRGPTDG